MSPRIIVEDHGHWAWLRINRPEAKNAIDRLCMDELDQALAALEGRSDLVLLGLTGAGNSFVAGGDIRDLAAIKSAEEATLMSVRMNEVLKRLKQLSCLTVAAINGDAHGGGCEIALACDVRIMSEDAQLHFKQVAMGLTPGWGGGQRLARLIGRGRATSLYATAASLNAERALAWGIVDYLAKDVISEVGQWADRMQNFSSLAIRNTKKAIFSDCALGSELGFERERTLFAESWDSEAHFAAVDHFLNRKS